MGTIPEKKIRKSPLKKLLVLFEESRDKWKSKHLDSQIELKRLRNKVAVFQTTTEKWRNEALLTRKQIKQNALIAEALLLEPIKSSDIQPCPLTVDKIKYHTYYLQTILLMVQLVSDASVSLRGSERVLNVVNNAMNQPLSAVPSWFSVRSWLLRIGYYNLMKDKQIANDWCWIIDHTIQLGKTKFLLVLGVRLSELPEKRSLQRSDLEIIELLPVTTSTGEIVYEQLEKIVSKTGVPRLIVSDNGTDVKLGVAKFRKEHIGCVSIYDIKHKTACLLKAELSNNKEWLEFTEHASQAKKQLQQTALSHIAPPNQRSKSRYMNLEILVDWAIKTLTALEIKNDFKPHETEQLHKLAWLPACKDKLDEWTELLQVAQLAEDNVRQECITREGYKVLEMQFNVNLPELKSSTALKLKNDLIDFVRIQGQQCRDNERLLGSSEIIESTFGKQKNLEQQYSKEGFTSLILGIGASIGTLTIDTVKQALHSTPVKKVTAWYKDILGETEQSKKRKVFSEVKNWKQSGLNL
jgi:hypothetical protein